MKSGYHVSKIVPGEAFFPMGPLEELREEDETILVQGISYIHFGSRLYTYLQVIGYHYNGRFVIICYLQDLSV
jgi:hypothetical protein